MWWQWSSSQCVKGNFLSECEDKRYARKNRPSACVLVMVWKTLITMSHSQTERQTDRYTGKLRQKTDRQTCTETHRLTDTHTKYTNKNTDTYRQRDTETNMNKHIFSECLKEPLLIARSLRLSGNQFRIAVPATEKLFQIPQIKVPLIGLTHRETDRHINKHTDRQIQRQT